MSFERLLRPEPALPSNSIQAPRARVLVPKTIGGGGVVGNDNGHRTWNQTIHHLFERRNEARTSRYVSLGDGEVYGLSPASTGAVTIRFGGGTVSLLPLKPPSVPQEGSTRIRQWSIRVRAFYAADTVVSWPANIIPAVGWTLEDDGLGGQTLARLGVLPGESGPGGSGLAGTSDVYELTYDERSGEWFCDWFVRGEATNDPETADPDATDPTTPPGQTTPTTPPGDPADPTDPTTDQDYTDTVTGDPLVPVQMPALAGDVVALHAGSLSYSTDAGSTWRSLAGSAASPYAFSILRGEGAVIVDTTGTARWSPDLRTWSVLKQEYQGTIDIPLENADFETGNLSGWTTSLGDTPIVIDTIQPEQRPGSTQYLTRDWGVEVGDYAVDQLVEIPDAAWSALQAGGTLRASADIRGAGSALTTGKIQVLDAVERVAADDDFTLSFSGGVFRANGFATSPTQGALNLVGTPGTSNVPWGLAAGYEGVALYGATGQAVNGAIAWRIEKADGSLYDGIVALRFYDLDNPNGTVETLDVEGVVAFSTLSSTVSAVDNGGGNVVFTGINVNGTGDFSTTRFHLTVESEFSFVMTGELEAGLGMKGPGGTPNALLGEASHGENSWARKKVDLSAGSVPSRSIRVRLIGEGVGANAADVYFDNVALEVVIARGETSRTVAPDYAGRRHVLATGASLFEVKGGRTAFIGAIPIDPQTIAADGQKIVLANSTDVRVSWDGGATWETHTATSNVAQLFAGPEARALVVGESAGPGAVAAVLVDGSVFSVFEGAAPTTTAGFAGVRAAYDRRRRGWTFTLPDGQVGLTSTGVESQQPEATPLINRRTLPLEIGRWIGYQRGLRDMFYTETPAGPWLLAPSIAAPILELVEVR